MSPDPELGPIGSTQELARFEELKPVLERIVAARRADRGWRHTSIVVPSLSVDQAELDKVEGAAFYEERLLFTLIRLAQPSARLVYVTSRPIHPETLDYYLHHLPGVPSGRARERLLVLCMYDASPKPLSAKILARPRVLERIRRWMGPPEQAYLTVYNSTPLERRLAVELGVPLNSVDPALLRLGSKSGAREVFAEAGLPHPRGEAELRSADEVVAALSRLEAETPGLERAVVKLNDSFAGEGNGVFRFPEGLPRSGEAREAQLRRALGALEFPGGRVTPEAFLLKLSEMGGVVEEWLVGREAHSPSVQMRIHPGGGISVLSTHDQVLGGSTGQVYLGCHFPSTADYRAQIIADARKVAEVLRERGVVGRFGIDFLTVRDESGPWRAHAIEINLRMGGTTPPFMALEFLVRGRHDEARGVYLAPDGTERSYFATDNLKSAAYKGLLPEDLFDLVVEHEIRFDPATLTGVMFFMVGALSQYGKLGLVAIGADREEAEELYRRTVSILDQACGAGPETAGAIGSLFEPSPLPLD